MQYGQVCVCTPGSVTMALYQIELSGNQVSPQIGRQEKQEKERGLGEIPGMYADGPLYPNTEYSITYTLCNESK